MLKFLLFRRPEQYLTLLLNLWFQGQRSVLLEVTLGNFEFTGLPYKAQLKGHLQGCVGVLPPQLGTLGKSVLQQRRQLPHSYVDGGHIPHIFKAFPRPWAMKAELYTTGGGEDVTLPSLSWGRKVLSTSPARIILLQGDTAELPKITVAWLRGYSL